MQNRPQIMVVDDEQSIVNLLRCALNSEGYDVVMAYNGSSAIKLFDEHIPDLVILDIMMPGLNGFQVLNYIRHRSSVPVIILTAKVEAITAHDALTIGADDYVRKPFRTQELLARIKAKLRRSRNETTMSQNEDDYIAL